MQEHRVVLRGVRKFAERVQEDTRLGSTPLAHNTRESKRSTWEMMQVLRRRVHTLSRAWCAVTAATNVRHDSAVVGAPPVSAAPGVDAPADGGGGGDGEGGDGAGGGGGDGCGSGVGREDGGGDEGDGGGGEGVDGGERESSGGEGEDERRVEEMRTNAEGAVVHDASQAITLRADLCALQTEGLSANACDDIARHITRAEQLAMHAPHQDDGAGVFSWDDESRVGAWAVASHALACARANLLASRREHVCANAGSTHATVHVPTLLVSAFTAPRRAVKRARVQEQAMHVRQNYSRSGDRGGRAANQPHSPSHGNCPCEREFRARWGMTNFVTDKVCKTWCPLHSPLSGGWHVVGYDTQQQEILRWVSNPGGVQLALNSPPGVQVAGVQPQGSVPSPLSLQSARVQPTDTSQVPNRGEGVATSATIDTGWVGPWVGRCWHRAKTLGVRMLHVGWSTAQSTGCAALQSLGVVGPGPSGLGLLRVRPWTVGPGSGGAPTNGRPPGSPPPTQ